MAPSEGYRGVHLYQWVVAPNGSPWNITDISQTVYYPPPYIVYNKVAYSFLALFNTDYARKMIIWIEDALPYPINGYYEGINEIGHYVSYLHRGNIANTLILEAARYALQKESKYD